MDWLAGLPCGSFRKTNLVSLLIGVVCFIALIACMKHARFGIEGTAYAAQEFPGGENPASIARQQPTVTLTATITPTVTASNTAATPTQTATSGTTTLTPSATSSPTATPVLAVSSTPTASATSLPTLTATPTPELTGTELPLPTIPPPAVLVTTTASAPAGVLTATATLIPFPNITVETLAATSTDALNYLEAPPGASSLPKGGESLWARLRRFWPLAIILFFWLVLGVWFVALRVLDRK